MKQHLLTLLLSLLLIPLTAQERGEASKLKPLNVHVPQKGRPDRIKGWLVRYNPYHKFDHDGKLVYYNGKPLRDSDYRKNVKVVGYIYTEDTPLNGTMISGMPIQNYVQILYISNNGNLYYQDQKLEGANPKKFTTIPMGNIANIIKSCNNRKILTSFYVKSNNRTYYGATELEGINTDKFHYVKMPDFYSRLPRPNPSYASDSVNIYYLGSRIANATIESFEIMTEHSFSKDKHNLYYKSEAVEGIDGSSFKAVDYFHFKDTNNVYMLASSITCDELLPMPDGSVECNGKRYRFLSKAKRDSVLVAQRATYKPQYVTVMLSNPFYHSDKYVALKRIPADPATFEVINHQCNHYYTKDTSSVFINGELIEGANPKQFNILLNLYSYCEYTTDDKHVYYLGKLIEGADPKYLRYIRRDTHYSDYVTDEKQIYYFGKLVEGADPQTFAPILGYNNKYYHYFKDKDRIYYQGKVAEDITVSDFATSELN